MKICSTCGIEKEFTDFHRDASKSDGFRNNCKLCSVVNADYKKHIAGIYQKTCNVCKLVKPLKSFIRDSRRPLGFGMECLECSRNKLCRGCLIKKPLSEFTCNPRSKDGFRYKCKECENELRRIKYKNNKEHKRTRLEAAATYQNAKLTPVGKRERLLWKHYKMTLEDYNQLLEKQNGRCKVCERTVAEAQRQFLSVDHDHNCCNSDITCGKCVRGLLCDNCNRGIGYLGDDPTIVSNALKYLQDFG